MKIMDMYFKFILNDDDVFLDTENDKRIVEEWIKNNYKIEGKLTISDDLVINCTGDVEVKNKNIEYLTNGLFRWGRVGKAFSCINCESLKSLEGAPKWVGGYFNCSGCKNITSLEGSPKKVGSDFYCSFCNKLESLKGSPKKIIWSFYCDNCINLKTLEGAPEVVRGRFVYSNYPNLKITKSNRKIYKTRE